MLLCPADPSRWAALCGRVLAVSEAGIQSGESQRGLAAQNLFHRDCEEQWRHHLHGPDSWELLGEVQQRRGRRSGPERCVFTQTIFQNFHNTGMWITFLWLDNFLWRVHPKLNMVTTFFFQRASWKLQLKIFPGSNGRHWQVLERKATRRTHNVSPDNTWQDLVKVFRLCCSLLLALTSPRWNSHLSGTYAVCWNAWERVLFSFFPPSYLLLSRPHVCSSHQRVADRIHMRASITHSTSSCHSPCSFPRGTDLYRSVLNLYMWMIMIHLATAFVLKKEKKREAIFEVFQHMLLCGSGCCVKFLEKSWFVWEDL